MSRTARSWIVLVAMREGTRTVLSMQNDYPCPPA
jgi:hypothetical protein